MQQHSFLFSLLLLLGIALQAQAPDSNLVFSKERIVAFSLDPLSQLFAINETQELIKYDRNGQELFRYHNTVLGDIGSVDANDPFNVLLFFPEQQTIVLLDRTLGDQGLLDLRTTAVQNATAALRSHDNNIWVYDDYAGRLYKLSPRGELLFTSNDFRLSEGLLDGATHIWRRGNQLLLNFPEKGVAVLSLFGQLQEWWPIEQITDGFLHNDQFYFQQDSLYQRYLPQQAIFQMLEWKKREAPVFYRQSSTLQYLLSADGTLKGYKN